MTVATALLTDELESSTPRMLEALVVRSSTGLVILGKTAVTGWMLEDAEMMDMIPGCNQ